MEEFKPDLNNAQPKPEESSQVNERPISPEDFFSTKIETYRLTKDNFYKLIKQRNPEMDDDKIWQAKGVNMEMNGKVIILLRTDKYPEQYMPYLETHEKWEAYIARKNGFNLWDRSVRRYKEDKEIDSLEGDKLKEFFKELEVYNYDFRHEYAIYKEYQQALSDGRLEEYHKWFMELRETEKSGSSEANLKLIENDTNIRESIYKKLTEGGTHIFTRN